MMPDIAYPPRRHRARVRLPAMTPADAAVLVETLQALLAALWRTYPDDLRFYFQIPEDPDPPPTPSSPDLAF